MSIRIGSSCVLSASMGLGRVVEIRRFINSPTKWLEVIEQAVRKNQYMIINPCISRNDHSGYGDDIPIQLWKDFILETVLLARKAGLTPERGRFTIINEPMKFISRDTYAYLINIAYGIIKKYGFDMGAGNEEFLLAQAKGNMYQYILDNAEFDILDIHIQGSCGSKADTDKWIAEVKSWIAYWQIPVDCTEAFYGDITKESGYDLLEYQMLKAEEIGCPNFCSVFNNLDRSMFPWDTSSWYRLCFMIDGYHHSPYWPLWIDVIDDKGPVPNIIIEEDDDMKLEVLRVGSKGNQVQWLQEILEIEYGYENEGEWDGIFGPKTEAQVKAYQQAQGITVDGIVGKQTTAELINMAIDTFTPDYWMYKLVIYMAYE
jgi:hypothetical protein